MKGIFAAGLVASVSSLVSANPSPVQLEARQASSSSSASLPTVTVRGNAFYAGDSRFYIRGIDYQPGGSSPPKDPLSNPATCRRDIAVLKELNINTIRVYSIDNAANHDECMGLLAAAGIYLALDVNTPLYSINRDNPAPSYNPTYLQSIFATIDIFARYSNTLLFYSGNEVINTPQNSNTAPYVKAVGRDMKSYLVSRGLRNVPIGYSAADVEENRYESALYFNCGTDDQRSDFFAFNDYSWCDPEEYPGSEWEKKVEQYSNYSLPLFLSEYGCIQTQRKFGEVPHLYKEMTPVYSGGLVYEYSEEGNKYGIVDISGNTVTKQDEFNVLATQFANNPPPQGDGGARTQTSGANPCPAVSKNWALDAFPGESLPAMPEGAKQYMQNGAGKGPGLQGKGSQDAGGASTATAAPGSGSATPVVSASGTTSSSGVANGLIPPPVGFSILASVAVVFVSGLLGAAVL